MKRNLAFLIPVNDSAAPDGLSPRAIPFCLIACCLFAFALSVICPSELSAQQSSGSSSQATGDNESRVEAEGDDKAMALYADAANFQTAGAFPLAIEAWNKFLKQYPDHPMAAEAAHFLGVSQMQKDPPDLKAAIAAFDRALRDDDYKYREESLVNLGWSLYAASDRGQSRDPELLRRVLQTFSTLREEFPGSDYLDRAYFYSGEAAYGLNQLDKAIAFYDRMLSMEKLEQSPLRCDAYYARGVAHEELKQFDRALASYRQLLESCQRESLVADVRLRMGDVMILQGDHEAAIESFVAAREVAKREDDKAYAFFRQAYAQVLADRPANAAATYDQLIEQFPDSPYAASAVLASAQSSYRSGDLEAAEQRFTEVLSQNNRQAATEAAHWLARIKISRGEWESAAELIRQQLDQGVEGEFALDLRLDLAEALAMIPSKVSESMELFEAVYREAPDDPLAPRALYNAAFSALQLNQTDQALQLANEFLDKFADHQLSPDVQFIAAEALLGQGQSEQAADRFRQLLTATEPDNPQRPIWLLRAGTASNAAQQYERTIDLLTPALDTLDPSQRAEAYLLIGNARFRQGDAEQATAAFRESFETEPQGPHAAEALLMAGRAQLEAGRPDAASDSWQQLREMAPQSPLALRASYELGQLASSQGEYTEAIKAYDRVLDAEAPASLATYARYGKGWAQLQSGQYAEATETLGPIIEDATQHPIQPEALLARGIARRHLGNLDAAADDLKAFLDLSPEGTNLGHALYEFALIDQEAKQPAKAAEKLKRLVEEVPDYPAMDKVLYELGWSLQEAGEADAAVKHFDTLIRNYPANALVSEAAYFVGQQYYQSEQWQQAAEQFEIAATKSNDASLAEKARYRLGWSRFKAGDYQAAEEAFGQQSENHPEGAFAFDALLMIGESRFKQEDYEGAFQAYSKAREAIRSRDDRSTSLLDAAQRQIRELALLHGGQSAAQLGQWQTAIEWYDELRERFPSSDYLPQVFYETGYAHQRLDHSEKALQFFGEVADNYRNVLAARARFMMGEIHFANQRFDQAIPEYQRVMYGYGADKAPTGFKNWQAKSGFEAGRCSELMAQKAKTASARTKSLELARKFYQYVVNQHPQHELADDSQKRLEALAP